MTVLNKNVSGIPEGSVYIGRGSRWGNPFVIGKDGTRAEVCAKYKDALEDMIVVGSVSLNDLALLDGRNLVCFCAPLQCHGDILEKAAAWAVLELGKEMYESHQRQEPYYPNTEDLYKE